MGSRGDGASSMTAAIQDLPTMLDNFVGRERELDGLIGMTANARLLTLTGPGGAGKTRLAIHLAARIRSAFEDGLAFVDLGAIEVPDDVPSVGGAALGLNQLVRPSDVAHALGNRHVLLLLDNCSHQVPACAELAVVLLSHCPRLLIIASS